MSMLIHRQEDQVHHSYHSSEVGLVDWIARNYESGNEIQIAVAFQNYGLLLLLRTDHAIELVPAQQQHRYREQKELLSDRKIRHAASGSYELHSPFETKVSIEEVFLESMRGIRVFQEAGRGAYEQHQVHQTSPAITSYGTAEGGVCFRIEREVLGSFCYRVDLFIDGAHAQETGKSFIVPAGMCCVSLTVQLIGRFPDEDYAPLTSAPMDLLKPEIRRKLSNSSPFCRELAANQLEGLSLLSRKGKLLAGGPRFFTYFGRDTLISIAMLTGTVSADLALHAFRSVLERLSIRGEVAHEETVGEYAALHALRQDSGQVRVPAVSQTPAVLLEYHMVDDDLLFPAVLAHWTEIEGAEDLKELLGGSFRTVTGEQVSGYELLGRTVTYCFERIAEGLIPYHSGIDVGDWRDSLSAQGIRYSYEVNNGLGMNCISAVRSLAAQLPGLHRFLPPGILTEEGDTISAAFREETARFTVQVAASEVRDRVLRWLEHAGFSDEELEVLHQRLAETAVDPDVYRFTAFGLDAQQEPIAVQHNDVAFTLLFGNPDLRELDELLLPLETPFPLGLKTDVGILVSNPVFASQQEVAEALDRSHYHGLVVWPLMNSLLYHGIQRQLKGLQTAEHSSSDLLLTHACRHRLERIKAYLGGLHEKLSDFNSSELWTFSPVRSGDIPLAFGKETGSATESNPLQLWSCLGFTTLFD
jgi:hypothetical protein